LLALKENKTEMAEFLINSGANIHAFDDLQRYSTFNFFQKILMVFHSGDNFSRHKYYIHNKKINILV
jgi:hypothetical protein